MKKITILLCVLMAIALATSIVIGILLVKKTKELNKKTEEIASLESQIKVVRDSSAKKDAKIKELNDSVVKKDDEIKKLNKSISKKKEEESKKAEEAKKVAENGEYESEDTTEIFESEGQPPEGTFRTLTVSSSNDKSITLSLEESESGGRRIDGFQEPVSVSLKNGSGSFKAVYGGGNYGMETVTFEGTINIANNKTISITCNNGKGWEKGETHTFKKK